MTESRSTRPEVILKPHEDRRLRRGHLWVFSNEIQAAPADAPPGGLVHFLSSRKEFLGIGFYNARSLIAGRVLDRRPTDIDAAFFEGRLRRALTLRERLFDDRVYRWIFGESDDLPGLVIDRFDDVLVVESFCAGMDALEVPLREALRALGPWKAVVVKNDAAARRLEQLPERVEVVEGSLERPHWFSVDGLRTAADPLEGQKTGYFLDQRSNRAAIARLASGKTVLDVFCHTGGFGLACARAGASAVTGIDESEPALALARLAAEKNGFADRATFERGDAFQRLAESKENYGVVIVDPPRFAASKKNLPAAVKAYVRLNALALKRVSGGGFLATSSCSQHVDRETFRQVLARAIGESGRRAVLVHAAGASPDHPVRPAMPETDYLKFAILHVT